tara:strand:- start:1381 stop:2310 length:930 start_codon:yes stop_codon:yes gene_type:complete
MSVKTFRKIFIEATALSNLPFDTRFASLCKKHGAIAFAHLGTFGHVVENLSCVKDKSSIEEWDKMYGEKYKNYIHYVNCKTEAVQMVRELQKCCTLDPSERFAKMAEKFKNLAGSYPLTFNNINETFEFIPAEFKWEGSDKSYMNYRVGPLKTAINAEFAEKLLKDIQCIYAEAKKLERLGDRARFRKMYNVHREFAKEHPIPFKYAVQNLELSEKAFRKYAHRYIDKGTNRATTAELSALYVMSLRGTKKMGEKEKANVRAKLIKEFDKDMQDMDDFIKDFKESYKEKEERVLELQKEQLYNYLLQSQ